ncbi:MAG TPA: TonB-dependent receptor, partial [Rhodanobacteraceae bacterium]
MNDLLLAPCFALALLATAPVGATDTQKNTPAQASDHTPAEARDVTNLHAVQVSARLNRARNALSPETGSSQYVIDRQAIAQLPLGASTP